MRFSDVPIRIKLITTSIILGVLPLVVVGVFGSRLITEYLLERSFDRLSTIQALKKNQVERSFEQFFIDMKMLENSQRLSSIIAELEAYRQQTGVLASMPFIVTSAHYKSISDKYRSPYLEYIENHGFHDLKIVSALTGQVMFTVAGERDLGTNLAYGRYKESRLAEVWREVISSGKTFVADFAPYEPSFGLESLFIGTPVFDDDGTLVSVVVVHMSPEFINGIMNSQDGMGATGESYLVAPVGSDGDQFEFRSKMFSMGGGDYVVGYQPENIPEYWKAAADSAYLEKQGLFRDSLEKEVLVTFNNLDIHGVSWFQVSKVDRAEVVAPVKEILTKGLVVSLFLVMAIIGFALFFARRIVNPIVADVEFAKAISQGDLTGSLDLDQRDELGVLALTLNEMAINLAESDWLKRGKEGLDDRLRGVVDLDSLGGNFINYIVTHLDAQLGAFYLCNENVLELKASYAFSDRNGNFNKIAMGEGLVGQAALERRLIVFSQVKDTVPLYNYGIDEVAPPYFMTAPFVFESETIGAFVVGSFQPFSEVQRSFIEQNLENVAIFINMAKSRETIEQLYEQGQEQQDELLVVNRGLENRTEALKASEALLQTQQEELRVTNEELEERTEALQDSQGELQAQQEELRVTNEDLQERTETLERQKNALRQKTTDLMKSQKEVERKAEEIEQGSKYKSEFLANMSHELRTPLNSILILSQILRSNKDDKLGAKEEEMAKAIHSSGSELLTLINEILDLSKVEAGKVELVLEDVNISAMVHNIERMFVDIADEKKLTFSVSVDSELPETIYTDSQRVSQIIRNLLTNAFKFTRQGSVHLQVGRVNDASLLVEQNGKQHVAFTIKDEGIGIAPQQQQKIFDAFKQADGSTSRTYGGTGLGLSISKQLTQLLGGTIHLESIEGEGSVFTLIVPIKQENKENGNPGGGRTAPKENKGPAVDSVFEQEGNMAAPNLPIDDRKKLKGSAKSLLVIEDDRLCAGVILDFARERGFSCILASSGEEGLHFADYYKPDAILLAIGLPGIDGWEVIERLKESSSLRHIPVHFMSVADYSMEALRKGAVGFLPKPVSVENIEEAFVVIEQVLTKGVSRLLVVEDDRIQAESIKSLIGNGDVVTTIVATGGDALRELESGKYDCMILDLGLEDMSGFELLDKVGVCPVCSKVPVIIYTGRDLSRKEEEKLRKYTESIIIKGAKSPERLLDESTLFLHRVEADLAVHQKEKISKVRRKDSVFENKTVLVVDDDMRNVFALTSLLESKGVRVVVARDGLESIEQLEKHTEINLVLMDIMMPKMDGIEAMLRIRKQPKYMEIPIIALTAKAMKGDRAKCIDAGANDYLAKPVNIDKLVSILKVWLY